MLKKISWLIITIASNGLDFFLTFVKFGREKSFVVN